MNETTNTFGNFLKAEYHRWVGKQLGKMQGYPSQNEFAKYLSVPSTSLSNWMNDVRPPAGDNVDKLADRLGVEVYVRLGLPPRMPRDKKLGFIATAWTHLPDEVKAQLYEIVKNSSVKGGDNNTVTE